MKQTIIKDIQDMKVNEMISVPMTIWDECWKVAPTFKLSGWTRADMFGLGGRQYATNHGNKNFFIIRVK